MNSLSHQERLELTDFAAIGLPEIVTLGRSDFSFARDPLPVDTHPNIIEFTYLARGRQIFSVGDEEFALTGGDLFMIWPNEHHSTSGTPREKSMLYWLFLQVPTDEGTLLDLTVTETREMIKSLLGMNRHFKVSSQIKQILDDIIAGYYEEDLSFKRVYLRNRLTEFLLLVLIAANQAVEPKLTEDIELIVNHIKKNIAQKFVVDGLAKMVDLSSSRLRVKFKAQLGIPISEYILRLKIEKSVEYLTYQERSITEVAHILGFSSSQYFATTFKRYVGKSPTEFLGQISSAM